MRASVFPFVLVFLGCAEGIEPGDQTLDFGEIYVPGEHHLAAELTSRGNTQRSLQSVAFQTGSAFRLQTAVPLELDAETRYPIDFAFAPPEDAFGAHTDVATLVVSSTDGEQWTTTVQFAGTFTNGDSDGDGVLAEAVGGSDCDDTDPTVFQDAPEVCDGKDNDCDGLALEDEVDDDDDGSMLCEGDCADDDTRRHPDAQELCDGLDDNCDGNLGPDELDADSDAWTACSGDCEPDVASVHPGTGEICDGYDTDCSAGGTPPLNEADIDGDGDLGCQGDCDDGDATVHPGATEICDGADTDCDGTELPDEEDMDEDGQPVCAGDCDDLRADRFVGNTELCDGIDNDCNLIVPAIEDDADGDSVPACEDCDDTDEDVFPGHPEECDLTDNNCDGQVDEGLDGDGDGTTSCGGDCDDTDPAIHPGVIETCDGEDEDCDSNFVLGEEWDGDNDGILDCADPDCPRWVLGSFSGTPDGSVAAPWPTIPQAVANAGSCSSIYVQPGTYTGALDLGSSELRLVGANGPGVTILDAQGAGRVLTVSGGQVATLLRGFTVTGGVTTGPANHGAGLFASGVSITLDDLVFTGNTSGGHGGGAWLENGTFTVTNSTFFDNVATGRGGGLAMSGAVGGLLQGLTLLSNDAGDDGGGLALLANTSPDLRQVSSLENTAADKGGGLYVSESSGIDVRNCIFSSNVASFAGGVYIFNSSPVFMFNTLWDNDATTAGEPGGLRMWDGNFRNNIIAGGDGYGVRIANFQSLNGSFQYNDVYGWTLGSYYPEDIDLDGSFDTILTGIDGNIDAEPMFTAATQNQNSGDDTLTLGGGSPCIDAANPASAYEDLDGSRGDLGAFGGPLGSWP